MHQYHEQEKKKDALISTEQSLWQNNSSIINPHLNIIRNDDNDDMRMKLTTAEKNWANLFLNLALSPPIEVLGSSFLLFLCAIRCLERFARHYVTNFLNWISNSFYISQLRSLLFFCWLIFWAEIDAIGFEGLLAAVEFLLLLLPIARRKLLLFMRFSIWFDMRGVEKFRIISLI